MPKHAIADIQTQTSEFSAGKDYFQKARKKGVLRWILAHIFHGTNKIFIFFVFFTTVIASILASSISVTIGNAVQQFLAANIGSLIFYTITILILGLITPILRLLNYSLREVLAQRLERDTRQEFYGILLGKSQSFHDKQQIGDLMARATDDVRMLNFLISPAVSLILESFTTLIIPIIFIILFYPIQLIFEPITFTILFLISLRRYNRKLSPITGNLRMNFGMINASLNEALSGIEVVKGSTQETYELDKYMTFAKQYRDAYVEQGKVQAKYMPVLFLGLIITLGLTHSLLLFNLGLMTIGQVISYIGLLDLLYFSTFISIFVFAIIKLAESSAERLLESMNQETEIEENPNGIQKDISGTIKFENVSFSYPGTKNLVLKNVSFEVYPGQTVAIVGTTGSGKTTLTKLISRLYDVSEGRILIDNQDIRNFALKSLRAQISYIEQDVFLFSFSVFENITFGRLGTKEKVIEAAKQAQAHEFISELPKAYESKIGERGVLLSGGERQRIAIARAFLADPKILILDDSTSAIDSNTEDKIQYAIKNVLRNRTTFLITHRLSQIRWADLIIVLKDGKVEAKGDHQKLLRTSEEYRKIFVKKFDLDEQELMRGVV
ncbi:MAG TPA: ABC transporter ATP-binding protein [Candidatus Nanopelagicaceae bacterium]|nr:ABC transporter ATP-binding protein [Candidatus Nanopelagicaceae bacterium]